MGRRKIEIQPITHERNRSVTFLKRKNGLFKKAYELGVLCSVDVAVIIFEERPGHHVKLYQYCSSDIHDIVQRHIRYDGEKDTRVPADFSGNAANKLDDIGEGDDDDQDDDDHPDSIPRGGVKRRGDGKLKSDFGPKSASGAGDLGMGVDLDYLQPPHRTMTIPPPPMNMHPSHQHHHLPPPSHTTSSSLPISSDRHVLRGGGSSAHQQQPNKRPRIAPSVNTHAISHSRSSSDDPHSGGGGGGPASGGSAGGYSYHPSPNPSSSYRHPPHPQHPPPHHSQSHGQNPNPGQYTPFFPVSTPPPSFLPNAFDYPHPTSSSRGPPSAPPSSSRGFSSSRYDQGPGMYQPLVRSHPSQSGHGGGGGGGPGGGQQGGGGSGGAPDLFAAFLDADEQTRSSQPQNPSFGLDWPVHAAGPSQSQSQQANPSSASSSTNPDNNWLDFLSGNGTSAANAPSSSAPGGNPSAGGPGGREPLSWERGERHELPDMFGAGSASGGSASGRTSGVPSPMNKGIGVKRGRVGSGSGHGSGDEAVGVGGTSPGSRINGRKDDIKVESNGKDV